MVVSTDEKKLIDFIRSCRRYSTITIQKKPSPEYPDGEIQMVKVEENLLMSEIIPVELEKKKD